MQKAKQPRRARGPNKRPTQRALGHRYVGALVPQPLYRALACRALDTGLTMREFIEAALSQYLGVTQ